MHSVSLSYKFVLIEGDGGVRGEVVVDGGASGGGIAWWRCQLRREKSLVFG